MSQSQKLIYTRAIGTTYSFGAFEFWSFGIVSDFEFRASNLNFKDAKGMKTG